MYACVAVGWRFAPFRFAFQLHKTDAAIALKNSAEVVLGNYAGGAYVAKGVNTNDFECHLNINEYQEAAVSGSADATLGASDYVTQAGNAGAGGTTMDLGSESTEAQRPFLAVYRELCEIWGTQIDAQAASTKKLRRITITIDIDK